MIHLFITWNPNPEIFSIGDFGIRWYGLLFALGFVFGFMIMKRIFIRENIPLKLLDSLTMYMIIGTVAGARLGHCFFYEPEYYLDNLIEIFYLRQGGLASHGAAIGILASLIFFALRFKKNILWIVDRIVIVVALAGSLIRFGNLVNSEIIGSPTDVPWAFVFQQVDETPRHASQLYEALFYLLVFGFLFWMYYKRNAGSKKGLLFGIFLFTVFGFRFFIEFIKDVQVDFEKTMTLNMGQILSIPFALAGVAIIVYHFTQHKKTV